jgi:hypothetical protein
MFNKDHDFHKCLLLIVLLSHSRFLLAILKGLIYTISYLYLSE